MKVFIYDQSFEGLLSLIFEAFRLKCFPDRILAEGQAPPLLAEEVLRVETGAEKAARVWAGLEKKLSRLALRQIMYAWLTGEEAAAELVLRYVRAIFGGVGETDFSRPEVMEMRRTAQRVSREREHLRQFLRFQKTKEGVFFAAVAPPYNIVPLCLDHFVHRYADQKWIIYDINRGVGYYYDLNEVAEIEFDRPVNPATGQLAEEDLADDELILQEAWRTYFKSVSIAERANPRLQRQFMPKRFWPYLTETQISTRRDLSLKGDKP